MVTIRFFAMLRGISGAEKKEYEVKGHVSLDELKGMLKKDFPQLAQILDGRSILISINQEFASKGAVIKDGDEVGLLPPFSGG